MSHALRALAEHSEKVAIADVCVNILRYLLSSHIGARRLDLPACSVDTQTAGEQRYRWSCAECCNGRFPAIWKDRAVGARVEVVEPLTSKPGVDVAAVVAVGIWHLYHQCLSLMFMRPNIAVLMICNRSTSQYPETKFQAHTSSRDPRTIRTLNSILSVNSGQCTLTCTTA